MVVAHRVGRAGTAGIIWGPLRVPLNTAKHAFRHVLGPDHEELRTSSDTQFFMF